MARFVKYSSIENHTLQVYLDKIMHQTHPDVEWVATEKVHGANMCLATVDGVQVDYFNRRKQLDEETNFYGIQQVAKDHTENMSKLFALLQERYPEMSCVHVYGELFGGAYPHDDVPPIKGVKHVQKWVWYSPDVRFYAFDIFITMPKHMAKPSSARLRQQQKEREEAKGTENKSSKSSDIGGSNNEEQSRVSDSNTPGTTREPEEPAAEPTESKEQEEPAAEPTENKEQEKGTRRWRLPIDEAIQALGECEFFHHEVLARGTFEQVLQYDVETMQTTIPARLGLPEIEKNLAEGVVLRPAFGSSLIKKKRDGYNEGPNHQTKRAKKKKERKEKSLGGSSPVMPEECMVHFNALTEYVNENRLRSVISKIGQVAKRKGLARLAGLTARDAMEDYEKDWENQRYLEQKAVQENSSVSNDQESTTESTTSSKPQKTWCGLSLPMRKLINKAINAFIMNFVDERKYTILAGEL